jgi:hypothetical protein
MSYPKKSRVWVVKVRSMHGAEAKWIQFNRRTFIEVRTWKRKEHMGILYLKCLKETGCVMWSGLIWLGKSPVGFLVMNNRVSTHREVCVG